MPPFDLATLYRQSGNLGYRILGNHSSMLRYRVARRVASGPSKQYLFQPETTHLTGHPVTITQTGGETITIIGVRSMQIAKSAIMEIERSYYEKCVPEQGAK